MVDPNAPTVGLAEPANGPAVFDVRLDSLDGAILLVGGGLVAGGVAGARGGGPEFDVREHSASI